MTPAMYAQREAALLGRVEELLAENTRLRAAAEASPAARVGTIATLMDAVAREFACSVEDLVSDRRMRRLVVPRQVVMHLAVTRLNRSHGVVARCLLRDRTTVLYGARSIAGKIAANPDLAARVARVAAAIQPQPETAP